MIYDGAKQHQLTEAFANWNHLVKNRVELQKNHNWKNVVLSHPLQHDAHQCGVYICYFADVLINSADFNEDFDPAAYRKTMSNRIRAAQDK